MSALTTTNHRRARAGAARQVATARADLQILNDAQAIIPGHLLAAGVARIGYPNDSLAQIAARLGVTKNVVSGRLYRLHQLAERTAALSCVGC